MADTIITLVFLTIAYCLGRFVGFRRGHTEAELHCQRSFVEKLRWHKQLLDEMLRNSLGHQATEVDLVVYGEVVVRGTLQDAAKKSLELGELIKTIDNAEPA